ncbi:hypothetical protein [Pseudovibrio axinellae]|uniref:hypothetical protein n=1 Tax=Pseudovibrio axinellae TaxID=989403 RepID=UPI003CC7AFCC
MQAQNNLRDEHAGLMKNGHLSFVRFLGLSFYDKVPDAKTELTPISGPPGGKIFQGLRLGQGIFY